MTTNSGAGWNCFQYSFDAEAPDVVAHLSGMQREARLPLRRRPWRRRHRDTRRSGTFESTTMLVSPGRRTMRSGVWRAPASVVTLSFSMKSHCSSMPASCTIFFSWISPQRPRTLGDRSERDSPSVASRSRSCVCATAPSCAATCAERPFPLLVHRRELRLHAVERFPHRLQQGPRILQKVLPILLKRLAGHRGERVAQLRLCLGQSGLLLLGRPPREVELRTQPGRLAGRLLLPQEADDDRGCAEDDDRQGGEECQGRHAGDCTPVT